MYFLLLIIIIILLAVFMLRSNVATRKNTNQRNLSLGDRIKRVFKTSKGYRVYSVNAQGLPILWVYLLFAEKSGYRVGLTALIWKFAERQIFWQFKVDSLCE